MKTNETSAFGVLTKFYKINARTSRGEKLINAWASIFGYTIDQAITNATEIQNNYQPYTKIVYL